MVAVRGPRRARARPRPRGPSPSSRRSRDAMHPDRARSSICSRSRRASRTPGRSALLITKTSATSKSPALLACMESPQPGVTTTTVVSARRRDVDLHLPDPDRLDDDHAQAGRAEQADGVGDGQGEPAEVTARRHRPDEHRRIERVLAHAHAVTQDGAAAEGRRRVHGEHRHLRHGLRAGPAATHLTDERIGQGGLAGARRPGEPDGVGDVRTGRRGAPRPSPSLRPARRRRAGGPARRGRPPWPVAASAAGSVGSGLTGGHLGAQGAQRAGQVLVAAADVAGAAHDRLTLGHQPGQHERHAGPDVGGAHGGAREPGRRRARPHGGPRSGCPRPSAAVPPRSGSARRTGSR